MKYSILSMLGLAALASLFTACAPPVHTYNYKIYQPTKPTPTYTKAGGGGTRYVGSRDSAESFRAVETQN